MFRIPLSVVLCVCAAWSVCVASEDMADLLEALDVRARQVEAGVFHFAKTVERRRGVVPSERAMRERVKRMVARRRKGDKAAGRERPEHIYADLTERELAIAKEVHRRRTENPVRRYSKAAYIDPPFARVRTREIVGKEEQAKRFSDFIERAKRSDPWASEEDLRSMSSGGGRQSAR